MERLCSKLIDFAKCTIQRNMIRMFSKVVIIKRKIVDRSRH